LFRQNPSHPGLNFKKVDEENNVYSARTGLAYRALGQIDGEAIVWFWIGPHGDCNKLVWPMVQDRPSKQFPDWRRSAQ
jgi:hypothetical protein